jgi:hypothetical protein
MPQTTSGSGSACCATVETNSIALCCYGATPACDVYQYSATGTCNECVAAGAVGCCQYGAPGC